ncbi:MAG: glycosyltransferase family 4 protein [Bacteroidaceae bacterium]|nr:glycosyltransferase family 4 protein [Bacteroidaceae bacterium]
MKIAFLSRILFLSGVTTHIRDLAQGLIEEGHTVHLLTAGKQFDNHKGMDELYDSLISVGVRIVNVGYPKCAGKLGYLRYLSLIPSFFETWRIFLREKYDIIHVHTPLLSFIPKLLGYKFVTTVHCAQMDVGLFERKPDHQIAISKEMYDEGITQGLNVNDISLVHNGVSPKFLTSISAEKVSELKEKYAVPKEKVVVGYVGRLCHRKGVDILVKACAALSERGLRDKVHIVFCGNFDNEGEKEWLYGIIQKEKQWDNVTFIPFQDPYPVYKLFDIFVLPSRLEGFGLVSVEAMLSGNCCVRSNVEGAEEQIEDGVTGFLFESDNYGQLSDILASLVADEEKRLRVAEAGREFAKENFSYKVMCRKTVEVYKKLLG